MLPERRCYLLGLRQVMYLVLRVSSRLLVGVQLIGIFCEFIGRFLEQVKGRHLTILRASAVRVFQKSPMTKVLIHA